MSLVFPLAALACNSAPAVETAPSVDLEQFQGKWYEVAHLPRPTQADCTGTTATYTKNQDGTLAFVHECTLTDGTYHGATATASVADKSNPAKLQVDFGGYLGDYWIIDVAPDYRYAVVGHPSRDYLWILSRTPSLSADDTAAVLAHAKAQYFDTSKLEYTPQGADPHGTPAPSQTYGCSASRLTQTGGAAFGLGLGAVGVLALRRRKRATA